MPAHYGDSGKRRANSMHTFQMQHENCEKPVELSISDVAQCIPNPRAHILVGKSLMPKLYHTPSAAFGTRWRPTLAGAHPHTISKARNSYNSSVGGTHGDAGSLPVVLASRCLLYQALFSRILENPSSINDWCSLTNEVGIGM